MSRTAILALCLVGVLATTSFGFKPCVVKRGTMAYADKDTIEYFVNALVMSINAGKKGFFNDVEAELLDEGLIEPVEPGTAVDILKLDDISFMGKVSTIAQVRIRGRLLWMHTGELQCK